MKKIVFLFILTALVISAVQAQLKQNVDKSNIKRTEQPKKLVPVNPGTPPAPPPVEKTTATAGEVPVYALTSVRVKIKTGNDNKEFPSQVFVTLKPRSSSKGDWSPFGQVNLNNEMRINSDTEFGLERNAQLRGAAALDSFQTSGLVLEIHYLPNFFADAWKIENVSLVLEFKDQHGNLHPTLGNKTIVFSNAYGFLNNEYRKMECVTDKLFAPLTAAITK
jgi:hypothetical protein